MNAKKAVILSLFDHVESHYAENDVEGKNKERNHLYKVLQANGYTKKFVRRTLHKALKRRWDVKLPKEIPKATVSIPYVENVSEKVARTLRDVGIRTVTKAKPWQWELCSEIKDKIPLDKKKGVVYRIKCSDCSASYIGETVRSAEVRKAEHIRHTKNGKIESSAVAEHVWNENHSIDWKNVEILDMEKSWMGRRVRESWHIAKHKPTMNKDSGLAISVRWTDLAKEG